MDKQEVVLGRGTHHHLDTFFAFAPFLPLPLTECAAWPSTVNSPIHLSSQPGIA